MTDLSTEEVIMNNEVKPPEESDFPKMHLVVVDSNDQHLETPYRYDPTLSTIRIAFVVPYSTAEFNEDLQFVVEVEGPEKAAEFVAGGSIGCDNLRRVSARHIDNNGLVVLQINDTTAKLRVWAGWATGHSAVKLVPDLILEPGTAGGIKELETEVEELENELQEEAKFNQEAAQLEEEIEDLEEEIQEEEFRNTDKEKLMRKDQEEKLNKMMNNREKNQEQTAAAAAASNRPIQDTKLQRKRKNTLQRPEYIPEGLKDIHEKRRETDLGLEIPLVISKTKIETKTIREKLKETNHNIAPTKIDDTKTKKHRLIDHTPSGKDNNSEQGNTYDDGNGTDDDLPQPPAPMNDDFLLDEGDMDDDGGEKKPKEEHVHRHHYMRSNIESTVDASSHSLACGFFVVSMGLIIAMFGKKRDKGRRDL